MQNRFKFRVWLEEENKMISPEDENADCIFAYKQHGNLLKLVGDNEVIWARIGHTIYDKHVMQCTGLKDKNGKLIYEGDIVKFKTELFGKPKQIIWDECHYILKNTFIILCDMEIKQFGLEVIGNVYENKELLESVAQNE